MSRITHTLLALAICAMPLSLWAGDIDVGEVTILKIHDLIQTSTADPIDEATPYSFNIYLNDSSSSSALITNAAYVPPGGSSTSLIGGGDGEFDFEQSFATQAAMDAAFPNGTYDFTLQTTTIPATYSPSLTLSGNSYPPAPKLSNTDWLAGKLQFDPSADYTFNWNGVGNFDIALGSEDNEVFTASLVTSITLPGGTLLPNQEYIVTISFGTNSSVQDGPTNLNPSYNTFTRFTIHTVPKPEIPQVQSTIHPAVEISWLSVTGQLYQVQVTPSLAPGTWTNFGSPVTGDGSEKSIYDQTRNREKRFYRVLRLQ